MFSVATDDSPTTNDIRFRTATAFAVPLIIIPSGTKLLIASPINTAGIVSRYFNLYGSGTESIQADARMHILAK
jgi:hypothetical protein